MDDKDDPNDAVLARIVADEIQNNSNLSPKAKRLVVSLLEEFARNVERKDEEPSPAIAPDSKGKDGMKPEGPC